MAMSKSRGSLKPPVPGDPRKCFDVPSIDPKEVQYSTVPVNTDPIKALNAEEYVKRSVSDLGVVDPDSNDLAAMLAYIEGSSITCTFYTQVTNDSYGRSAVNTFSESINPIHQRYRKINNFQMKLKDQVQFGYEQSGTQSNVQGEAVLYPYFCPYQGDLFIYDAGNGKLGLYKITEPPVRLSIADSTCHEIKFILVTWVTNEILAKLNACVVDEAYFNLTSFLNSRGALLTSDEAELAKRVKKAIAVLTHHYVAEYFEQKIYRTFIENACLYDPYIVEFCLRLFDSADLPMYPIQLKPNPKHWTESFWHMLLDPDYTPEEILVDTAAKLVYGVNYRTVGVTALTNRCYIELEKCGRHLKPYPCFAIPKKFDPEEITVPMQIRLYFSERKVFPEALLTLAKEMLSVRRIAGFYFIPVVIFLLKKLLAALESGDVSIIYREEKEPDKGCVCDCSDCLFNCNPPHLRFIPKCPGHAHHQCSFSNDCNSIYIPPCGGCSTDPKPYPGDYLDPPKVYDHVDLRYASNIKRGFYTGNCKPDPLPHYGLGPLPIHCDHPVAPPPPPPCPCPSIDPSPRPKECSGCSNTPYTEQCSGCPHKERPPQPTTLTIERPPLNEGLYLVVESMTGSMCTQHVVIVDTEQNYLEPIGEGFEGTITALNGEDTVDLSNGLIPQEVTTVQVELTATPGNSTFYRYQWRTANGVQLGWSIY